MEDFKCPHCNKKIELGEVAKKQAKIFAAQEIKDAKKEAEKKATEEAQKILDKERKQKDLEIKDAKKTARAIALNESQKKT